MRTLLLISVLTSVAADGAEAVVPMARQKLLAKIVESVPPPPPPSPESPTDQREPVGTPVMMKSVIVSDSKLIRAVTAAIEREEQERREEPFSALKGGKILNLGRVQIGGWWSPSEGWTFLRLNKGRTHRQAEAADARLKELQELANFGARPKS